MKPTLRPPRTPMRRRFALLAAAALVCGSAMLARMAVPLPLVVAEARAAESATVQPGAAADTRPDIVKRGEYLARAGDCVACHTAPRGRLFAGGLAMETPFGTLYSPNITPDAQYGIGTWSEDAFFRMMRTGITPEGKLLYPAMPIAQYTKVTREDSDAIFAYLKSVEPVREANHKHTLRFPFNQRKLLYGWRTLYFREGEFKPDPTRSVEWNRGAYLVEGLGHCTMCHTKINMLGGSSQSEQFAGGLIPVQNWYAPSLTSDKDGGLGDWSIKDIVDLLQAGISDRGAVYGPMAEVTYHSLQYMTDEDAKAMAAYSEDAAGQSRPQVGAVGGDQHQRIRARRKDLRRQVRAVPRRKRRRQAAALSAARREPVDRNGLRGEPDPHRAERRLPAWHATQPGALRHAAFRAGVERHRSRRRRDVYPHRVGQPRQARDRTRSQRTAQGAAALARHVL